MDTDTCVARVRAAARGRRGAAPRARRRAPPRRLRRRAVGLAGGRRRRRRAAQVLRGVNMTNVSAYMAIRLGALASRLYPCPFP